MAALRLAIAGAAGRMGRALAHAAEGSDDLAIVSGAERADSADIGAKLTPQGAMIHGAPGEAAKLADAWIDFTIPKATLAALAALPGTPVRAAIIGTTGFDRAGEDAIAKAATRIAIVKSGNFSLGVNMLAALVAQAAARLSDWDIEIVEGHHRRKIDAPSGTALLLGEAAAEARGLLLDKVRAAPREGMTGPRIAGEIGFSSVRGGGIIGEHDVIFAAEEEYLRLSHVALDRALFARGALAAARWAADKKPGLYSMRDVLGL
jgi:4-hydroxy-tetrahydrodipicolinate reductase